MDNKVTSKGGQLFSWLNRIFPPSSPRITQPGAIDELIKLTMPALPPSLIVERFRFATGVTVNPATSAFFPGGVGVGLDAVGSGAGPGIGVPVGKFLWVHAADWYCINAIVGAAGFAFIRVRPATALAVSSGLAITTGIGVFETTDIASRCCTHAVSINATTGFSGGNGGGGVGGFVVPEGCEIHFATGATAGATTQFRADIMFTLCDYGELIPPIG